MSNHVNLPAYELSEASVAAAVRDGVTRGLAVVGLAAVALIHVLDAHDSFVGSSYQGWLYLPLIAGCLLAAAVLARRSDPRAWLAALVLPLGALVAFVWSRTAGLPGDAGDIGNWGEPLGLASLFVEALLVWLSAAALSSGLARVRLPAGGSLLRGEQPGYRLEATMSRSRTRRPVRSTALR